MNTEPRRLGTPTFATAIPWFASQFEDELPSTDWCETMGRTVRLVCRCDHKLLVELGVPEGCNCGRWFVYDGEIVRVADYENPCVD